jgi:hypothetical protein
MVEHLAAQLGIEDTSCVKRYTERPKTAYEHAWEIRDAYGYHPYDDAEWGRKFRTFLHGRAWTHAECVSPAGIGDDGAWSSAASSRNSNPACSPSPRRHSPPRRPAKARGTHSEKERLFTGSDDAKRQRTHVQDR